jgi:hypothetical protein
MSPAGDNPLAPVLLDLGARLGATAPEAERRTLVEARLSREGMEGADAVPAWLLDLLRAVRDRRLTEWIDFARGAGDDTHVLDFVRGLPDLLPVAYQNNEESWLLTFPRLNVEACISLEGSCYKVSELGKTWG